MFLTSCVVRAAHEIGRRQAQTLHTLDSSSIQDAAVEGRVEEDAPAVSGAPKVPSALKLVADTLFQTIDIFMPCAIHPTFRDQLVDLYAVLGSYHIVMVSIDDVRLQACAILSVYANVRARRAALKGKESSCIGCVAPSTLPCESTRCALARVAILTQRKVDSQITLFATKFSKFLVVPCEWILCSLITSNKSRLDKEGVRSILLQKRPTYSRHRLADRRRNAIWPDNSLVFYIQVLLLACESHHEVL